MCDTMGASGSATLTGNVLFGKNSDRDCMEAQYLMMVPGSRHEAGARVRLTYQEIDQARETHAVLLSKPHWIWGAEMGANEHGLVIGNEAIFSTIEASLEKRLIGMDYVRLGLERARSTDEAVHVMTTLLRQHGQGGNAAFRRALAYHNSFLLADFNSITVLETVDRDWVVRKAGDCYAISNAMSVESQFDASSPTLMERAHQAGWIEEGVPFSFKSVFELQGPSHAGSHHRRDRAMALLRERRGRLVPGDFFRVLRDHEEGPQIEGRSGARICAHRKENPIGQTTGSWVADLTPGKTVHWVTATSAPCTGLFKPVLFETGLPEHGSRAGADEDKASLWWRHEQLRRVLDTSGAHLMRDFTDERDALEARFLELLANCPPLVDDKGRGEARRAVEACWKDGLAFEARWYERLSAAHG